MIEKRPAAEVKPVLKYAGAKWRLADWIIDHFPQHEIYLEPFFGSGAVFFRKPPARLETINDLDGNVVNLFRVLREEPEQLAALIELTPWARDEYYSSYEKTGEPLEDARRFLVRCWQAFGTMTAARTGWRHSATGRSPVMPRQWCGLPERLSAAAWRLKDAQIENMDAEQLIKKYNDPRCLIYADPPYTPETRRKHIYAEEMTLEQHLQLLEALKAHSGSVVLSGYDNEIYNDMLTDWRRVQKTAYAERGQERTEVLWIKGEYGGLLEAGCGGQ